MSTDPDPVTATAATVMGAIPAGPRLVDDHDLPVCEVFGPTVQGEGPYTGHRAMFVRLGRCNLSCTWCDSAQTWDETRYDVRTECPETSAVDIATRILEPTRNTGVGLVIITGGEPLLHQRRPGFRLLLDVLGADGAVVHVETNGTIAPAPDVVAGVSLFAVSPKLTNNRADPARRRVKGAALEAFRELAIQGRAMFKFVAAGLGDLVEVDDLCATYGIPDSTVWIMPEGTDADTLLMRHRQLAEPVIARGWNITSRLHIMIWGSERGR